jgi:hypothetical protein
LNELVRPLQFQSFTLGNWNSVHGESLPVH